MQAQQANEQARALAAMRPQLLRLARLQLRHDSWAEDVVSETLLAALEGAARFRGDAGLKTWVVGILKHKIVDQLRRSRREVTADALAEIDDGEPLDDLYLPDGHLAQRPADWGDPESALARSQFFEVLRVCVERLPPALSRIFLMREWLEYESDEICRQLAITPSNCFVMLHRARMRLRACLEFSWFADGRAA